MIHYQFFVFLLYIISGLTLSLEFEIFRLLRKKKKHKDNIIIIEDIIFILSCIAVFTFLFFKASYGIIRLYNFLGIILGILCYLGIKNIIKKQKINEKKEGF